MLDTSLFDALDPGQARMRLIGFLLNDMDAFPRSRGALPVTAVVVLACPDVEFALQNISAKYATPVLRTFVHGVILEADAAVEHLKTGVRENWPATMSALDALAAVVPIAIKHTERSFPAVDLPDAWVKLWNT